MKRMDFNEVFWSDNFCDKGDLINSNERPGSILDCGTKEKNTRLSEK